MLDIGNVNADSLFYISIAIPHFHHFFVNGYNPLSTILLTGTHIRMLRFVENIKLLKCNRIFTRYVTVTNLLSE